VAASGQATAEAEAKFTPTPVPTYVYNRPEQLKNAEMVSVPGGTFAQSDGKVSFKHTLSAYKIGKYAVTYELWYVVKIWAEKNGYKFQMDGMERDYGQKEVPTRDSDSPVRGVSWRDAIVWCNAYSQMMKLKPVYCSDARFKDPIKSSVFGDNASSDNQAPGSFDNPYVDWSAAGYRLPTEGEWLYAVSYIDGKKWLDPNAQSNDANGLGFVYRSGIISEFMWDRFGDYPSSAEASAGKPGIEIKDYRGPETGGPKVLHGGIDPESAVNPNTYKAVSIGCRISQYPLVCSILNGFRVAQKK
jgi:hypothetical protein